MPKKQNKSVLKVSQKKSGEGVGAKQVGAHHLPMHISELFGGKKHIRTFAPALAQGNHSTALSFAVAL